MADSEPTNNKPVEFIPQVAPGFVDRLRKQEEVFSTLRSPEGEKFAKTKGRGDYGYIDMVFSYNDQNERLNNDTVPENVLSGMEVYFSKAIERLLKEDSNKPIVVTDLGGMAGLSWCRLANHFQEKVKAGKIVFVVTNIAFNPDHDLDKIDRLTPEAKSFIKDTKSLVHYVNADSSNINNITIKSPKGDIKLAGNVDILHENMSVTAHSLIPEFDINKMVIPLLSSRGHYCVLDNKPAQMLDADIPTYYQREQGIKLARQELSNQSLQAVKVIEEGSRKGESTIYTVYKKPSAPKIQID